MLVSDAGVAPPPKSITKLKKTLDLAYPYLSIIWLFKAVPQ